MIPDERKSEIDSLLSRVEQLLEKYGISTYIIAVDRKDAKESDDYCFRTRDRLSDLIGKDDTMELLLDALQRVGQDQVKFMNLSDFDKKDGYVS